jgi:23S rRNA pseudouridine2605 synthase
LKPKTKKRKPATKKKAVIEAPAEAPAEIEAAVAIEAKIEDEFEAEVEAAAEDELETDEAENEAVAEAEDGPESEPVSDSDEEGLTPRPRPPAKLERLQKILAHAGVASRRKAEEMIEQGRIQVNGKIVTELGTKADAGRDHIRVDGKLLQGAERLRYYVLNKPRGFVTTVKDPEGRPTVMQFFEKMRERLYPVGRLDYLSEGLLVVTNDGELANRLTRAASGVEKTYLVKVSGQPTEAELDILRGGVAIERGKPGSPPVRTSPARIRQVRQGDNPWYEVVLIEGRNRELRKMFEEIGHFVEKIRRVGYGPLVLDQEPGNLRELGPEELDLLRKAAEGKLRTPKSKELRRRNATDAAQLPTVAPRPSNRPRPAQPFSTKTKPFEERSEATESTTGYRPNNAFGTDRRSGKDRRPGTYGPARFDAARPTGSRPSARPAWQKDDRPTRPPARFNPDSTSEARPVAGKTYGARPSTGKTYGAKPAGRVYADKPAGNRWSKPANARPSGMDRPFGNDRTVAPRREVEQLESRKPSKLFIEPIQHDERSNFVRPDAARPSRSSAPRTGSARTGSDRPYSPRPSAAKPFRSEGGLSRPFTTSSGKPRADGARPSSKPGKPAGRSYGSGSSAPRSSPRTGPDSRPSYGAKRPFSDKPAGGFSRSSEGPAKRSFRRDQGEGSFTSRPAAGSGPRPTGSARSYTPRTAGYRPTQAKPYPNSASLSERKAGPGWKPKPSFGGPGKPAGSSHSKPKPGGFSKSGYKSNPGGKRADGKKRG